jgi:hypothetical protein
MRAVTPEVVGAVVAAAIAAVLFSACDLREGDGSEYGNSQGGYGINVDDVTGQKALGKSGVVE